VKETSVYTAKPKLFPTILETVQYPGAKGVCYKYAIKWIRPGFDKPIPSTQYSRVCYKYGGESSKKAEHKSYTDFSMEILAYVITAFTGTTHLCPIGEMASHSLGKTELPGQYRYRAPVI